MQTGCPSLRQVQLSVVQPFHPAAVGSLRPGWALGGPGHIPYAPLPTSLRASGAHTHPPKGLHSWGPSLASLWETLLDPRLPLPKRAELQKARPDTVLTAFASGTAFTPFLQMGKQAGVVELDLNPPVLSLTPPAPRPSWPRPFPVLPPSQTAWDRLLLQMSSAGRLSYGLSVT